MRLFPERAHLVGVYALGKAQRLMALIREAGYGEPIYIHGALERLTDFYRASGIDLGDIRRVAADERGKLGGAVVLCPPSAIQEVWSRRFPDPVTALASGWMRVRARGRQQGVELPLVISDHCDWDELCQTILETGAGEVWVTHGQEDALVHWCISRGIRARPLHMLGYGDEEGEASPPEGEAEPRLEARPGEGGARRFWTRRRCHPDPVAGTRCPEFDIKMRKSETSDLRSRGGSTLGSEPEGGLSPIKGEGEGAA